MGSSNLLGVLVKNPIIITEKYLPFDFKSLQFLERIPVCRVFAVSILNLDLDRP